MIRIKGPFYLYTGNITNPNIKSIMCCLCRRAQGRYGNSIPVNRWVARRINDKVQEYYCPTCARKRWGEAYKNALAKVR